MEDEEILEVLLQHHCLHCVLLSTSSRVTGCDSESEPSTPVAGAWGTWAPTALAAAAGAAGSVMLARLKAGRGCDEADSQSRRGPV